VVQWWKFSLPPTFFRIALAGKLLWRLRASKPCVLAAPCLMDRPTDNLEIEGPKIGENCVVWPLIKPDKALSPRNLPLARGSNP